MPSPLQEHLVTTPPTLPLPEDVLASRILGVRPTFSSLTQDSELCTLPYLMGVPLFMHVPLIDLSLHTLTPQHRRVTLYHSALSYKCAYCTRHAAVCGDIVNGSLLGRVTELQAEPELMRVLREGLGRGVSKEAKEEFEEKIGNWKDFVLMCSFCAWLNCVMTALDIPSEEAVARAAEGIVGEHSFLKHADVEKEQKPHPGWMLGPALMAVGAKTWWLTRGIGTADKVPKFVQMGGGGWALRTGVAVFEKWEFGGKWKLCREFAREKGCRGLEQDAEFMDAQEEMGRGFEVAVQFVQCVARGGRVELEVQERIVDVFSRKGVLDFVGAIGLFGLWCRIWEMGGV